MAAQFLIMFIYIADQGGKGRGLGESGSDHWFQIFSLPPASGESTEIREAPPSLPTSSVPGDGEQPVSSQGPKVEHAPGVLKWLFF